MLDPSRTNSMQRAKGDTLRKGEGGGTLSRKGDTLSRQKGAVEGGTLSRQHKGDTLSRNKGDTLTRKGGGSGDNSTLGRKGILKTANNAAAAIVPPVNPGLCLFSLPCVLARGSLVWQGGIPRELDGASIARQFPD